MSDDNLNNDRQRDANPGASDDNMDTSDVNMDSDEDDYEMANEHDVIHIPAPMRVGPHRVQSRDGRIGSNSLPDVLFNSIAGRFLQSYRVLSARHLESRGHTNLESGGKLILPPHALEQLSRNSSALMRPMMFKVTNRNNGKTTHCGVLEFIAEEMTCYMPSWMMDLLGAADHDMVQLERVELPTATFAKFQPQSVDFLEISDQRAVLENTLRNFACLTKGDMITIHYNSKPYQIRVLETLPRDAVTIIDCDMNVDFAAPIGYVSPSASDTEEVEEAESSFSPFAGSGNRLNGKNEQPSGKNKANTSKPGTHGPDTDWAIGSLQFKRKFRHVGGKPGASGSSKRFTAFGGMGLYLRSTKKSSNSNDDLSGNGS